jgi:hypothetical protein
MPTIKTAGVIRVAAVYAPGSGTTRHEVLKDCLHPAHAWRQMFLDVPRQRLKWGER